jgi:hypothetical protein
MRKHDATGGSAIKVGDLVQIVHQCCSADSELGEIFLVAAITTEPTHCSDCGYFHYGPAAYDVQFPAASDFGAVPLTWLKRIPPPAELGIVDEKEDIREPA